MLKTATNQYFLNVLQKRMKIREIVQMDYFNLNFHSFWSGKIFLMVRIYIWLPNVKRRGPQSDLWIKGISTMHGRNFIFPAHSGDMRTPLNKETIYGHSVRWKLSTMSSILSRNWSFSFLSGAKTAMSNM